MTNSSIPFCPHDPHPKQQAFLALNNLEAFFGGAAGGGKSAALLMAALQYVDQPGYSALILRRDLQRLQLAGGLIPRSHEWLAATDARWNGSRKQWTFPHPSGPPATLTFGYLSGPFDKFRYASSEFQYLGFDELTEIREDDYLFLFSRLRRIKSLAVPLRVRSASNPGNIGHLWVKQRFVREWTPVGELPEGMVAKNGGYEYDGRMFVPSFLSDNPSLDAEEYLASLMHLPPLERERLAHGDWSVQEEGIFRREWLRYYVLHGEQYELLDRSGVHFLAVPQSACRRFATVDPAGTAADRVQPSRTSRHSYSVVQVWDQPRSRDLSKYLLLRDEAREQVEIVDLVKMIRQVHSSWKPEKIWIEEEKLGQWLAEHLKRPGPGESPLPVELISTQNEDKVVRAALLANKMERGEVFLPSRGSEWRSSFEAELLAWTGGKRERSDQIDAAAYAAIIASQHNPQPIRIQRVTRS